MSNLKKEEGRLEASIKAGEQTIAQLEKRKKEQTDALNATIKDKKQIVETEVEAFRTVEMSKARAVVEQQSAAMLADAQLKFNDRQAELQKNLAETEVLLNEAKAELEDYRKKQQAINEAILRQRAIDEQQDFYRVNLSEFAIEDIKLL
jgi:chromosome segregation ATPase